MKNQFLIFGLLVLSNAAMAQNNRQLDTIYANDKKNVALFFPNGIRQGITGSNNFVFTYNRDEQQYFGLLQAQPGTESNLLAITEDGQVYSYILKYSENLSRLNYFISKAESIGTEKPLVNVETHNADSIIGESTDKTIYFKRVSEYLLRPRNGTISTKRKNGIVLRLLNMEYYEEDVYLVLEIKNKSGIDFEINYLNIYCVNGNNRRKASYQRLKQEVLYKYHMPNIIFDEHTERLVYVLPKFVLGDNEKLEIKLVEKNGHRRLTLN